MEFQPSDYENKTIWFTHMISKRVCWFPLNTFRGFGKNVVRMEVSRTRSFALVAIQSMLLIYIDLLITIIIDVTSNQTTVRTKASIGVRTYIV